MFLVFGGSPEVAEYCKTRMVDSKQLAQLGLVDKNEVYDMYSVVVGAWALKTRGILLLDLHDVDLSRNKRQSESDSIQ